MYILKGAEGPDIGVQLFLLLYAEDIILFANDLKLSLNILENFVKQRMLKVNSQNQW